jgi:hypothetical protein
VAPENAKWCMRILKDGCDKCPNFHFGSLYWQVFVPHLFSLEVRPAAASTERGSNLIRCINLNMHIAIRNAKWREVNPHLQVWPQRAALVSQQI